MEIREGPWVVEVDRVGTEPLMRCTAMLHDPTPEWPSRGWKYEAVIGVRPEMEQADLEAWAHGVLTAAKLMREYWA